MPCFSGLWRCMGGLRSMASGKDSHTGKGESKGTSAECGTDDTGDGKGTRKGKGKDTTALDGSKARCHMCGTPDNLVVSILTTRTLCRTCFYGKQADGDSDGMHSDNDFTIPGNTTARVFYNIIVYNNKSIPLEVTAHDSIELIKACVASKEFIDRDTFRLQFRNKDLCEAATLSDYNIQKDSELQLVMGLIGGAPAKRRRVQLGEMRGLDTDPAEVQALFALQGFDLHGMLVAMAPQEAVGYLKTLEEKRTLEHQAEATLGMVPAIKRMKEQLKHAQSRLEAVEGYLASIILDALGGVKKGEWVALVRAKSQAV